MIITIPSFILWTLGIILGIIILFFAYIGACFFMEILKRRVFMKREPMTVTIEQGGQK